MNAGMKIFGMTALRQIKGRNYRRDSNSSNDGGSASIHHIFWGYVPCCCETQEIATLSLSQLTTPLSRATCLYGELVSSPQLTIKNSSFANFSDEILIASTLACEFAATSVAALSPFPCAFLHASAAHCSHSPFHHAVVHGEQCVSIRHRKMFVEYSSVGGCDKCLCARLQ
jgi:hypothetical protein